MNPNQITRLLERLFTAGSADEVNEVFDQLRAGGLPEEDERIIRLMLQDIQMFQGVEDNFEAYVTASEAQAKEFEIQAELETAALFKRLGVL